LQDNFQIKSKVIAELIKDNDARYKKDVTAYFFMRTEKDPMQKDLKVCLKMIDFDFKKHLNVPKKEERIHKDMKWHEPLKKEFDCKRL
jgi:hypothetical protein